MPLPIQAQEAKITIPFDPEFLGDVLITAFDGDYGGSWQWFSPDLTKETWLETGTVEVRTSVVGGVWNKVHIKGYSQQMFEESGDHDVIGRPVIDAYVNNGFAFDQEMLARAMATVVESQSGDRLAAGVDGLVEAILAQEAGDIDSIGADALVQIAVFGAIEFG